MDLWRISNYPDLSGFGGTKVGGRWHTVGQPVTYLGENPSLCMLETLVHLEIDLEDLPEEYKLSNIHVTATPSILTIPEGSLPLRWREDSSITRTIGDDFLSKGAHLLMKVPSALVPHQFNYIYNSRLEVGRSSRMVNLISVDSFPYDERLLKKPAKTP